MLVANETSNPGWIAEVDGAPTSDSWRERTSASSPGVAGSHTVEMKSAPRTLVLGAGSVS